MGLVSVKLSLKQEHSLPGLAWPAISVFYRRPIRMINNPASTFTPPIVHRYLWIRNRQIRKSFCFNLVTSFDYMSFYVSHYHIIEDDNLGNLRHNK